MGLAVVSVDSKWNDGMGGATSRTGPDGVLDPSDPAFAVKLCTSLGANNFIAALPSTIAEHMGRTKLANAVMSIVRHPHRYNFNENMWLPDISRPIESCIPKDGQTPFDCISTMPTPKGMNNKVSSCLSPYEEPSAIVKGNIRGHYKKTKGVTECLSHPNKSQEQGGYGLWSLGKCGVPTETGGQPFHMSTAVSQQIEKFEKSSSQSEAREKTKKLFTGTPQKRWATWSDGKRTFNWPAYRQGILFQLGQDFVRLPEEGKLDPDFSFSSPYGQDWFQCNCGRKTSAGDACRGVWGPEGTPWTSPNIKKVLEIDNVCKDNVMMRCEDHIEAYGAQYTMQGTDELVTGACKLVSLKEIAENCATRPEDVKGEVSFPNIEKASSQFPENPNERVELKGKSRMAQKANTNQGWGAQQKERYVWHMGTPVGAIEQCYDDDANCYTDVLSKDDDLEDANVKQKFNYMYKTTKKCCAGMRSWFGDVAAIYELSPAMEAEIVYKIRLQAFKNAPESDEK